jgi:hypothetical protein
MHWKVVPLLPPLTRRTLQRAADADSMGLVPSKFAFAEWMLHPPDDVTPEPGVHYRVNANALAGNCDYVLYPESEALATFRHC